jgi:hypothetical protein
LGTSGYKDPADAPLAASPHMIRRDAISRFIFYAPRPILMYPLGQTSAQMWQPIHLK